MLVSELTQTTSDSVSHKQLAAFYYSGLLLCWLGLNWWPKENTTNCWVPGSVRPTPLQPCLTGTPCIHATVPGLVKIKQTQNSDHPPCLSLKRTPKKTKQKIKHQNKLQQQKQTKQPPTPQKKNPTNHQKQQQQQPPTKKTTQQNPTKAADVKDVWEKPSALDPHNSIEVLQ